MVKLPALPIGTREQFYAQKIIGKKFGIFQFIFGVGLVAVIFLLGFPAFFAGGPFLMFFVVLAVLMYYLTR